MLMFMSTDRKREGEQSLTAWQQFELFVISSWMYFSFLNASSIYLNFAAFSDVRTFLPAVAAAHYGILYSNSFFQIM